MGKPRLDEDTFVMPSAWRRFAHSRRDRGEPEFQPDQQAIAAGAALVGKLRTSLERIFGDPRSAEPLAEAGRAYLAGDVTPFGAAVVRMAATFDNQDRDDMSTLVHYWVAEHGVVFAAEAVLNCAKVTVAVDNSAGHFWRNGERAPSWVLPQSDDLPVYSHFITVGTEVIRTALAAASDADYAAAEAALEPLGAPGMPNVLRAYLMPTRSDWVAEALAEHVEYQLWLLVARSVGTADELAALSRTHGIAFDKGVLYTLIEAVGPAVVPRLAAELDTHHHTDFRKRTVSVLAAMPTDEAFLALLDRVAQNKVQPALLAAMKAYPRRAARLLAERALEDKQARTLFDAHLKSHPDLELPEQVRAVADEVTTSADVLPDAPADLLPPLLVDPPWTRSRKQVKPIVVTGLEAPEPSILWEPGEREQWAAVRGYWDHWSDGNWAKHLETYHSKQRTNTDRYHEATFFARAPEEMIRPLLADWTTSYVYYAEEWGKVVVAKYGLDALPAIVRLVAGNAPNGAVLLMPYASAEVAALMADWLSRLKSARKYAVDWLVRHGETAVRLLVPAALGKPGAPRANAEAALRFLGARGHDLVAIAGEYGEEAQNGIRALVDVDETELLPAKLPALSAWVDSNLLPQVRLRDGQYALPSSAINHLLMTAALSKPAEVYAGLPIARDVCDPASLASFGWALFELWQQAGAPSKDSWAFTALGWFGDDETVRRLSPLIRQWPGESQHQRAVAGLDVLAEIGTEVALAHLNGIAEKVKFKALKARAREKVAAIAAQLGLSREQLADRLVPRLGLDDTASLTIDYGTRKFTVGFDEQLKPYVVDSDGKRRKDLPKPGARDDQEVAAAEYKRFTALKKDVRTIASDQIHRLEAALVTQRTWTATEFRDLLAGHPLLWHIVRRLVWTTDAGETFRLAEDRTFANADDDTFVLPDDAVVRIAHPVTLDADTLAAWGEVFADYEILQPFPQLGRPVHEVDPERPFAELLEQFEGLVVPVGKLLGLTKRGWVRGEPQDAGIECWITRPLPSGGAVVVGLEPGIAVGLVNEFPEQKVAGLSFSPGGDGHDYWSSPRNAAAVPDVDAVTASELLSEFASLTD
ncbi:DUF4132 domain-containing protein [Kibdelosporangium persicum]|uniref:WGR domain-containing protein, putative DNA-binding domain in MolR n=1 Tax=Kibdelosporangium persicum TaxID=2698649 RepID=A0ABX2F116_9PSEU|nr:DUF4132 domain-containing protein [Kibdelosporangium persicum]NRN64977.1 WGR domain-containing protein, putative DNA-binding domain in MolR [Kibdelosporangium persicum]